MMANLPVAKILWILAQGLFLPLVLWLDDLRTLGNYAGAGGIFIVLEVLYMADAFLFLKIFRRMST